ncbi:MAG: hypothetical protein LBV27_02235 [Oscillospiraceae bacterium]|jgi:hypothetical protein|nr:hypothetical protein [Oscillospiraceae bacterium]
MSLVGRLIYIVLAAVLCVTAIGVMEIVAYAKPSNFREFSVRNSNNNTIDYIAPEQTVTISFLYTEDQSVEEGKKYTATSFNTGTETVRSRTGAKLSFEPIEKGEGSSWNMRARIEGIKYMSTSKVNRLEFRDVVCEGYNPDDFVIDLPESWFERGSSSGSSGGTESDYKSDIVVENIIITDKTGERIDRVTKDTPAFNIGIVYAEYGSKLREEDFSELPDDSMEVFLTTPGGFISSGGFRGTVRRTSSSSSDAPRFRIDFKNFTWDGSSNSIGFQVRYDMYGEEVTGNATAAVYQARAKTEDDEDTIPPPTPYIIVNQFSYGEGQIEAGNTFDLNVSFKNTSDETPLENIVMTVTPPEDFSIATASNTFYIDSLAAGASMQYTIGLGVKPSAAVGSHSVQIGFTYQYLSKKERKENKTTENIAVPVTQIDRFDVDPITEIPSGVVGEAAYVAVSFINRGKSTTYNISGTAKGNLEIIAPAEHFGNLEAGKSDSIDVTVVPQEAGELFGEVVIQYEDENTNQKEISVPFTMFVEEPYRPQPPQMPDPGTMEPETPGASLPTVILCVVGGLLMAAPIALYLMKRVKAKGSEAFDEDF